MNVAIFFTFLRLVIVPLFPCIYLQYSWFGISEKWMPLFLLLVLFICEMSDVIDGFLARRRKIVTDLGKILDPMADSITHILVFFTFTQGVIKIPLLLVFVFLYREFFIATLRTLCALKGIALAARKSGKIKAIMQAVVSFIIIMLLGFYELKWINFSFLQNVSLILTSLAAIYAVISALEYIYVNWDYIKRALSTDSNNL